MGEEERDEEAAAGSQNDRESAAAAASLDKLTDHVRPTPSDRPGTAPAVGARTNAGIGFSAAGDAVLAPRLCALYPHCGDPWAWTMAELMQTTGAQADVNRLLISG